MKILIISRMFPNPQNKTNGIFVYHRVKKLIENGHECLVIDPQPKYNSLMGKVSTNLKKYDIPNRFQIEGIDVISPKYFYIPQFKDKIGRLMGKALSKRQIIHEIINFNPNIIHAHGAIDAGVAAISLSKALDIPYIITSHGSDINYSIGNKTREKYLFQALTKARRVIFVSNALKEKAKELKEYDAKNAIVIPNGVCTNLFTLKNKSETRESLKIPKDLNIILFVGNLLEVKGVQFLPEILKKVRKRIQNAALYLIGDGPMKAKIIEDARKLDILEHITFVGRKPQDEVAKFMNAANVLILPSLNEGYGAVINESLACGTPVVASNAGGIPEALGGEEYGKIFPVGNVDKASKAVIEVLSKEWNREKLREKALNLSWNKIVEKEIEVYIEVLKDLEDEKNFEAK